MSIGSRFSTRSCDAKRNEWKPRRFDLNDLDQRSELQEWLDRGYVRTVHDTLQTQLEDLVRARQPNRRATSEEVRAEVDCLIGSREPDVYGNWFFYPWSGHLVHLLPEMEFRYLRSSRNRHKITDREQETLSDATIAIAGLSVGMAATLTLALEGIGRRYRLADFDRLGLSNLNRLPAGVQDLGVNKAVLAARRLVELDPYLEIEVFLDGVTPANVERFLADPTSLLVEECDDFATKVRLREVARSRRIPVLMDTSDRGLLDIERFDLEPERDLLHGLLGSCTAGDVQGLGMPEKIAMGLRILQTPRLSIRLLASLPEIGQTIETWPQLASSVTLGGALIADTARRILLDRLRTSGRFYVDLESLIQPDNAVSIATEDSPRTSGNSSPTLPPRPATNDGSATEEEIRYLLAHAVLAPSGGNSQPWHFTWSDGILSGFVVPHRTNTFLDTDARGCYLALGAALENLLIAASTLGLEPEFLSPEERSDEAWRLRWKRKLPSTHPLFEYITRRATNRRPSRRGCLTNDERSELQSAVGTDACLRLLEGDKDLETIGRIMGACDRAALLVPQGHREIFQEIRFSTESAVSTGDGLDLSTFELSDAERVALEILANPKVVAELRSLDAGESIATRARLAVAGSLAVGALHCKQQGRQAMVKAGRALERMWLTATKLQVAVYPWTALSYLSHRVDQSATDGWTEEECCWFRRLRDDYRTLFPLRDDEQDVFLFLLKRADTPSSRSSRRPLDQVLTIRR